MITDRLTAKVLGLLMIILSVIIDVSCFIFVRADIRARAAFPLIVILPSLPFLVGGAWLIRKGSHLKDEDD